MNDTTTSTTTPAYRLEGVGRRYGSGGGAIDALGSIDLEVGSGDYVVVAGSSGSGKSTLLQLLGALDRPTSGTIEFEGRDLGRMSEACLLYTSPSPRDGLLSRMPSSA